MVTTKPERHLMQDKYQAFARCIVENLAKEREASAARAAVLQAAGYRVVGGGQTSDGWEVTDSISGEVLASGTGGSEEYDAVELPVSPWHEDNMSAHVLIDNAYEDLGLSRDDAGVLENLVYESSSSLVAWATGLPAADLAWMDDRDNTQFTAPYSDEAYRAAETWLAETLAE